MSGRTQREIAVYDILDELDIKYARLDHDVAPTIEACAEIDELMQTPVCKNLFLCNGGKTQFYLLLMTGDKRFSTKDFSRLIGCSRLSFAPAEYMEALLGVTPGSVTALGLMNDTENSVKLYIDKDVLADEYMGCHPCINTSSLTRYCLPSPSSSSCASFALADASSGYHWMRKKFSASTP